jgi:hypothetical protein
VASETNHETTAALEARAQRAERALADALRERNELWAELQTRTAQERHVEHMQQVLADMQTSLSWRLTAPLRTVKRLGGPVGTAQALRHRFRRR